MVYQARLTWESLLLFEMQSVAELLFNKKTWSEIRAEVIDNNLFQYNKVSSAQKRFWLIKRRFSYLNNEWYQLLLEDSNQGKIIALYTIARDSLLFFDFLRIALSQKIWKKDLVLYQTDVEAFLQLLWNQWTEVEQRTSKTKTKLKKQDSSIHGIEQEILYLFENKLWKNT